MKHVIRRLLSSFARSCGYAVSGNLIFTRAGHEAISAGRHAVAVSEAPERHGPRIVRAAELLARTYDRS